MHAKACNRIDLQSYYPHVCSLLAAAMKTQRPTNHQLLIIDRFQSQASEQMPFLEFEMEAEKRYRLQSMTYIIMNVVNLAFRK